MQKIDDERIISKRVCSGMCIKYLRAICKCNKLLVKKLEYVRSQLALYHLLVEISRRPVEMPNYTKILLQLPQTVSFGFSALSCHKTNK